VISTDFMRIAEGLHHLDPVRSYPARAARLVADLARAASYSVEIERGAKRKLDSTPPPPSDARALSLRLRHGPRHAVVRAICERGSTRRRSRDARGK
jgi:hypothetical protein